MSGAKEAPASPKKTSPSHAWAKEESITALSHCGSQPKFSFSKANRFKWQASPTGRRTPSSLQHSQSCPTISTELPAADSLFETTVGGEADLEDSGASGALFSSSWRSPNGSSGSPAFGKTWSPDIISPRLDTSVDRFFGTRERAALPNGKSYPAAPTIGQDTALIYNHAGKFSFGGGKSRMSDLDNKDTLKRGHDQEWETKRKAIIKAREEETQQAKARLEKRQKAKLSRGFGSAVRLRIRGGPMELPPSPGPAAYELHRECDQIPEWLNTSINPWGRRTENRPEMRNPTATDAGPGEYIADHPFHASRPSPVFGHPFRPMMKESFTGPGQYPLATSVGTGEKYSVGTGNRPPLSRETVGPGPAGYNPPMDAVTPYIQTAFFGYAERPKPGDGVDPDEPPGPGAHTLKDTLATRPNPGLPKEEKLKKVAGMGPVGFPSPGDYKPVLPKAVSITCHLPIKRPIEDIPGPGEYDPNDLYPRYQTDAPGHASLRYTNPRKGPFDTSSASDASSAALMQRAAAAAAESQGPVEKKPKEKEAIAFEPTGPKWSLRRALPEKSRKPYCKAMYGRAGSIC